MRQVHYRTKPTIYKGQPGGPYDTRHIITDVGLKAGALLHRFEVIPPDHLDTGADPVPYSAIYKDGVEVYSNPRKKEAQMIREWNKYGADAWEASEREDQERQARGEHKYNKVPGCIYEYQNGCKGCKHNIEPSLYDGGCMIMHPAREAGATV